MDGVFDAKKNSARCCDRNEHITVKTGAKHSVTVFRWLYNQFLLGDYTKNMYMKDGDTC
jgi:hypothetical protein